MSINAEINPSARIVAKHVTLHSASKSDVGLSNVDNTSDADKPISTLTQAALDLKANISTTYTKAQVDTEITNNALLQTNNLSDLTNAATARGSLGLSNVTNESKATMFTNPVFTGTITGTLGTASAAQPNITSLGTLTSATISGDLGVADKIKHSSSTDTNTSIRFPTDDTFTIETAGAERFRVDSNGRIGIATNPSHKLHVKSPGTIGENPENLDNATIRVENDTANLYIDGNEVVSDHNLYLQTTLNDGFISLAADDGAGTRVNIANASADGFAIGKGDTTKATKPLDVTGDAIFRGKGTFGVTGDVTDAEAQPSITLFKPKANASIRQTRLTIGTNNDEAAFEIQTFDSNNTFISNDYRIEKNASGADLHEFNIGNSPRLIVEDTGISVTGSITGNVTGNVTGDLTGNVTGDLTGDVTADKIITKEIQCEVGSAVGTGADAQPINYDAKEHRFRDFDQQPTNLMVISKFNGYTGARIGINKEPSSSNAVALHIVAGKNASTNVEDLALKVIGGAFFNDFIRIGHYTDATRPISPTNGTVIYNQQHHEYQGFVGGGTGWQKFNMSAVST